MKVSGLTGLNTNEVGGYLLRYNVRNSAQLGAVEVVRMVQVDAGTFAIVHGMPHGAPTWQLRGD